MSYCVPAQDRRKEFASQVSPLVTGDCSKLYKHLPVSVKVSSM
jgi:hypothetical protein